MRVFRVICGGLIFALAIWNGCSAPPRGVEPWQHYLGCAALCGIVLFVLPKEDADARS